MALRLVVAVGLALGTLSTGARAQETRKAAPGAPAPAARVADLAWLAGTWRGEGISGPAEEVYSAPMGGQIVGHFAQSRGDGIWFYELMTIAQVGDSLQYRLKHFNADLSGWEEKGEMVRFPLVAVEEDAWYFDGLTIRRDGPDAMIGAVRIDNDDGTSREAVFRYRRLR